MILLSPAVAVAETSLRLGTLVVVSILLSRLGASLRPAGVDFTGWTTLCTALLSPSSPSLPALVDSFPCTKPSFRCFTGIFSQPLY